MAQSKNAEKLVALNEHALIAVQILTSDEENKGSMPQLDENPKQHFLKWALSSRKASACAVTERFPSFSTVVELIMQAPSEQRKGKTIRDIIASEFNAAFRFSQTPGYMENADYCAFVTALILIILSIDSAAVQRPEVVSHAKSLLGTLENFETFDNQSSLHLTICSEWFANYGNFRELFQQKLDEVRRTDDEVHSTNLSSTSEIDELPERSVDDGTAPLIMPVPHKNQETGTHDITQKKYQPATNVESVDDLLSNADGVERIQENTLLNSLKSSAEIFNIIQDFANDNSADLFVLFESKGESGQIGNYLVALQGMANQNYPKWNHFGHFSVSDRWVITVAISEMVDDTSLVNINAYGQGKPIERIRMKDAGLAIIEMSLFYAEKLILQIFDDSVRSKSSSNSVSKSPLSKNKAVPSSGNAKQQHNIGNGIKSYLRKNSALHIISYYGEFDIKTIEFIIKTFVDTAKMKGIAFDNQKNTRGKTTFYITSGGTMDFSWEYLQDQQFVAITISINRVDATKETLESIFTLATSEILKKGIKIDVS